MQFTVHIPGLEALAAAISKLAEHFAQPILGTYIKPEDRPDAGAPTPGPALPDTPLALMQPPPAAPAMPAFAVGFVPPGATAAAPVTPGMQAFTPGGAAVPLPPPPAPSTAVAAASPIAPAVPTLGLPTPPAAALPPAAPLAPTAAAPSAPVAPPSPASAAPAYDVSGLPWDGRIHAANKSTNKDGTWRQKRGTAETYVKDVERELRAAVTANAQVFPATVAAPPVAAAPAAPAVPASPLPPAAPAGITFAQLCLKVEPAFTSGRLTWDIVNPILARHGLTSFNQLMHAPAVVPAVDADISAALSVPAGAPA